MGGEGCREWHHPRMCARPCSPALPPPLSPLPLSSFPPMVANGGRLEAFGEEWAKGEGRFTFPCCKPTTAFTNSTNESYLRMSGQFQPDDPTQVSYLGLRFCPGGCALHCDAHYCTVH